MFVFCYRFPALHLYTCMYDMYLSKVWVFLAVSKTAGSPNTKGNLVVFVLCVSFYLALFSSQLLGCIDVIIYFIYLICICYYVCCLGKVASLLWGKINKKLSSCSSNSFVVSVIFNSSCTRRSISLCNSCSQQGSENTQLIKNWFPWILIHNQCCTQELWDEKRQPLFICCLYNVALSMLDELAFMRRKQLPISIIYLHVLEKFAPNY